MRLHFIISMIIVGIIFSGCTGSGFDLEINGEINNKTVDGNINGDINIEDNIQNSEDIEYIIERVDENGEVYYELNEEFFPKNIGNMTLDSFYYRNSTDVITKVSTRKVEVDEEFLKGTELFQVIYIIEDIEYSIGLYKGISEELNESINHLGENTQIKFIVGDKYFYSTDGLAFFPRSNNFDFAYISSGNLKPFESSIIELTEEYISIFGSQGNEIFDQNIDETIELNSFEETFEKLEEYAQDKFDSISEDGIIDLGSNFHTNPSQSIARYTEAEKSLSVLITFIYRGNDRITIDASNTDSVISNTNFENENCELNWVKNADTDTSSASFESSEFGVSAGNTITNPVTFLRGQVGIAKFDCGTTELNNRESIKGDITLLTNSERTNVLTKNYGNIELPISVELPSGFDNESPKNINIKYITEKVDESGEVYYELNEEFFPRNIGDLTLDSFVYGNSTVIITDENFSERDNELSEGFEQFNIRYTSGESEYSITLKLGDNYMTNNIINSLSNDVENKFIIGKNSIYSAYGFMFFPEKDNFEFIQIIPAVKSNDYDMLMLTEEYISIFGSKENELFDQNVGEAIDLDNFEELKNYHKEESSSSGGNNGSSSGGGSSGSSSGGGSSGSGSTTLGTTFFLTEDEVKEMTLFNKTYELEVLQIEEEYVRISLNDYIAFMNENDRIMLDGMEIEIGEIVKSSRSSVNSYAEFDVSVKKDDINISLEEKYNIQKLPLDNEVRKYTIKFVYLNEKNDEDYNDNYKFIKEIMKRFPKEFNEATLELAEISIEEDILEFDYNDGELNVNEVKSKLKSDKFANEGVDFYAIYTDDNISHFNGIYNSPHRKEVVTLEEFNKNIDLYTTEKYESSDRSDLISVAYLGEIDGYVERDINASINGLLGMIGYNWCCNFGNNYGTDFSDIEINQQGTDFYRGLDSPYLRTTPMGSDNWQPNGDGSFSRYVDHEKFFSLDNIYYHPITLYFMGLLPEERYDESFAIYNVGGANTGESFNPENGEYHKNISIKEIYEIEGDRILLQ